MGASKINIRNMKFFMDWMDTSEMVLFEWDSKVKSLFVADAMWSMIWRGLIYMINLWSLLVNANELQDMIFNSLAAEFLVTIDQELVDAYFSFYPPDPDGDGKELHALGKARNQIGLAIGFVVTLSYGVVAIMAIFLGPLC